MKDLPYLVRGLALLRGVRVRGLADHFHFAVPLWRRLLAGSGAVPGTRQNCAALLAADGPVLVFPGGAREVYKRRNQRYQLLWGNRVGPPGWRLRPAARSSRSARSAVVGRSLSQMPVRAMRRRRLVGR